jgi:hypothetical protein
MPVHRQAAVIEWPSAFNEVCEQRIDLVFREVETW